MKRSEFRPDWSEPHLLSFVTNSSGGYLAVHSDLAGITMLIDELEILREQLLENDCPHTHLFSHNAVGDALTATKIAGQESEELIVYHVKIYGWTEEWALHHGLKTETT